MGTAHSAVATKAARSAEGSAGGWSHAVPAKAAGLAPQAARSFFTHPAYLQARGFEDLIIVHRPEPLPPALFLPEGANLRYLGRLDRLGGGEIEALSSIVFGDTCARSVLFEDIVLDDSAKIARLHASFRYQANWRRGFGVDEEYLSSRQASNLRRRMRRLREHCGPDTPVHLRFGRCRPGDVAAIAELNRAKIERAGGRYRFSRDGQEALERVAAELGYTSGLFAGEKMIAGTVICLVDGRAFFHIVGYDLDYARFAPGIQVYVKATEELAALGCREGNFLWGDSTVKAELGAVREELKTVLVMRSARSLLSPHTVSLCASYGGRHLKARVKDALKTVGTK